MPPPPPPAPPPPPGPPPPPLPNFVGSSTAKPVNRNALLGEIRLGTNLKKAKTNDRSAPTIDNGKPSNPSESFGRTPDSAKSNGPTAPMGLGGLFAQGMPKLKPAGNRTGAGNGGFSLPSNIIKQPSTRTGSNQQNSAFQPTSLRNGPTVNHMNGTSPNMQKERSQIGNASQSSRSPFPNDVPSGARGPPPPPPLASHKPQLLPTSNQDSRPAPPSKPPGVTRSVSQTSLNGKMSVCRGAGIVHKTPPTTKPPPPPKALNVTGGPPALPSKPPNLSRRKSFGGPDFRNGVLSHSQHQSPSMPRQFQMVKSGGPPPPPRNISVPDSLNQMHNQSVNNYNNEPPPLPALPPPPPPSSAKLNVQGMVPGRSMPNLAPAPPIKPPNVRPPPPPSRAMNLGAPPAPPLNPPTAAPPPPPPPHHRMAYPSSGGGSAIKAVAPQPPQHMTMNNNVPPPPPTRNVSTLSWNSREGDFEAKYLDRFHHIESLPRPPPFGNIQKSYPSKVPPGQNRQRNPPPPPPSTGCNNSSINQPHRQAVLHIQLDSKMFDSPISQC